MSPSSSGSNLSDLLFTPEKPYLAAVLAELGQTKDQQSLVFKRAARLAEHVRSNRSASGSIDAFLQEYALSSEEGVVLMCLAEALLRIPDAATADKLIADKLGGKKWQEHLGKSESLFVNASTWGLMLTGKLVKISAGSEKGFMGTLGRMASQSSEPIIRASLRQAMRIMGKQFVLGRTIEEALAVAKDQRKDGYTFSFDMLGEAAMTAEDAARYFTIYRAAGVAIANENKHASLFDRASLSIKLSALHPRFEEKQKHRVIAELLPRVLTLAQEAKAKGYGLTVDAEEAARLELTLDVFAQLAKAPELAGWNGLGLAVQAYGRRARAALENLAALAHETKRRIPIRLVKGAYWDAEIKRAQEGGFDSYPVFTSKSATDVNYLACAKFLLENQQAFYPQFATHNAQTIAEISVMAGQGTDYEFQRLHGMGEQLYAALLSDPELKRRVRIYAPVGSHEDLLSYLVRRLLENGANTSFVNRLADDEAPIEKVVNDPRASCAAFVAQTKPSLPSPAALFGERQNSPGIPLWDHTARSNLFAQVTMRLASIQAMASPSPKATIITSPHDRTMRLGAVEFATPASAEQAMTSAHRAHQDWDRVGANARATCLEKAAQLYLDNAPYLVALLIREAGKTIDTAWSELREAVDFLRFYARQARAQLDGTTELPGPTGELNEISLHGRGVFVCISPWNFPLAIFTGQLAAALAAGNSVIAKPAEQTPLVALAAVSLIQQAGVPKDVLHVLPGDGATLGNVLLSHKHLSGVAFTGSNETARLINTRLANRNGAILPFIAETGGINAMIADSSALPEQVVRDLVASAFDSAGQRCSAARILYIQADSAHRVLNLLSGAAEELVIGDPMDYSTDVGPVIDSEAQENLNRHKQQMRQRAKTLFDLPVPSACSNGTFVSPAAYELDTLAPLDKEIFGPILHVVKFSSDNLGKVVAAINATGYGLTCSVHTRIGSVADNLRQNLAVGNLYINRNQIGAIVESQPFGGEGLSGTGPKAGGYQYLQRFATERVCSTDTTAAGGNAALMTFASESE
jgi:RHH-type transcriptional regulator, proline utilization regulon repressor / proline dehydrogenase / delta 1-pyrroline-5-carboxylate dehydrogenase